MTNRENAEKEIEWKLHNYKFSIAKLRFQAQDSIDEEHTAIVKKINHLDEIGELAEARLTELRDANEESWGNLKKEVENYLDFLGRELEAYDPKQ